jgi:hypothetical protein
MRARDAREERFEHGIAQVRAYLSAGQARRARTAIDVLLSRTRASEVRIELLRLAILAARFEADFPSMIRLSSAVLRITTRPRDRVEVGLHPVEALCHLRRFADADRAATLFSEEARAARELMLEAMAESRRGLVAAAKGDRTRAITAYRRVISISPSPLAIRDRHRAPQPMRAFVSAWRTSTRRTMRRRWRHGVALAERNSAASSLIAASLAFVAASHGDTARTGRYLRTAALAAKRAAIPNTKATVALRALMCNQALGQRGSDSRLRRYLDELHEPSLQSEVRLLLPLARRLPFVASCRISVFATRLVRRS